MSAQGLDQEQLACVTGRVTGSKRQWTWWEKTAAELGRRRWSAAELARRIGEGPEKVRKWLSGMHVPIEGAVAKIAKALGWTERFLRDPVAGPTDWPMEESLDDLMAGESEAAKRALKRALSDPRMRAALIAYGESIGDETGTSPPDEPAPVPRGSAARRAGRGRGS